MSTSRRARRLLALLLALLAAVLVWTGSGSSAFAADDVNEMAVEVTLDKSGSLSVVEHLTFDAAPNELTQRLALTRAGMDKRDYRYEVSDVKADADGKDLQPNVQTSSDAVTITVRPAGATKVTISYTVTKGATLQQNDESVLLRWKVLQGLSLPVQNVTATVTPPSAWNDIDCVAGDPAAPRGCKTFSGGTEQSMMPFFNDGPIGANGVMDISLRFPSGVAANEIVKERWSLDRAFSIALVPLLSALGALLLGGLALWVMHRKAGRDAAFATPTRVAEFRPVGECQQEFNLLTELRPGQVGTLMDEQVDPVDVTATILDLAVRGHLRILELPRESAHAHTDWSFERLDGGRGELLPYEAQLRDAIAPAGGTPVKVSEIGPSVTAAIPGVQSALYDEMVSRQWYSRRPDQTRHRWTLIGWIAVVVALVALGVLMAFTHFGLLGLVLVALAIGLLLVGGEMPARTEAGASMLSGLGDLRHQLLSVPTDTMPQGREYAELSEVLPYAIVLGGQERWLSALAAADDDALPDPDDLTWYHAPSTWTMADFPGSIDALITTLTGKLFRRA